MKLFRSNGAYPALTEGIHFFPGVAVQKKVVDLVVLNSGDNLTTLLYPLDGKQKREAGYFEDAGLTKREAQVAALVSQGKTNQQIAKMLYISKATLKTHICHIYRKMPHLKEIGFRRSGLRGN